MLFCLHKNSFLLFYQNSQDMNDAKIKQLLDRKVNEYNHPRFVARDPICVPHQFALKQDIEISAFFAATFAWGNRSAIINKCNALMQRMDNAPHAFILQHQEQDLKSLLNFSHRTFNGHDLLYFIRFLQFHYTANDSLEQAFRFPVFGNMKDSLQHFHTYFFSLEHLQRTRKHVSNPAKRSACKRLNMFLRWMVRNDDKGVDLGIWQSIPTSALICPMDIHVCQVAARLGLIDRCQADWKTAIALTGKLKTFDADDPVKYDFALFALGVEEKFN